ncbi:hypothetical protein DNTS_032904 [Danionella cerebrum]|uniref:Protein misato homolog 1 n=1 Tax=Danionella cerebrum TaxID=2873325 RepID=A0A553R5C1_9TELE|nr:hypothetical protein DNTS_032904 [Danionella translucida]
MSGSCREVVTLQLGHYANFVGTHWWNLQDASLAYDGDDVSSSELQSDVMFREGLTLSGQVTYTPRLIALDVKGSLQTLRKEGRLYDTEEEEEEHTFTWEGAIVTHEESPPEKNSFLQELDALEAGTLVAEPDFCRPSMGAAGVPVETVNCRLERTHKAYWLEGSVRVWSDFLRLHLHPRTVSIINQYNHEGESERLEVFGQGEALLQGSVLEDLEDRLHFFTEECDYLQGFQVLCDLTDGFSGVGSKVTELLRDSYGGRGILTWGVAPVNHPDTSSVTALQQMMNCALGTLQMANHSSLFCPLTLRGGFSRRPPPPTAFPLLHADPLLRYHSSSVLALALDSMTVPYRLRQNAEPMWQLSDALTGSGRKVVSAFGAVPFPMMLGSSLPAALDACADALPWRPLSACAEPRGGRCFGQSVILRGVEEQWRPLLPGVEPPSVLHQERRGEDVLSAYLRLHYPSAPLASHSSHRPSVTCAILLPQCEKNLKSLGLHLVSCCSKLTPPFPQFFSPALSSQGFLQNPGSPPSACGSVSSLPVLTSLQCSSAAGGCLSELQRSCAAVDLRRVIPSFLSHGPELSELSESLEQLRRLAHRYRPEHSDSSSSDEED